MTTHVAEAPRVVLRTTFRSRWPQWVAYAAAGWALIYGALALYWALGGAGFPFGAENDRGASESLLAALRAQTAAPVIAGLGLAAAVVAVVMARTRGHGWARVLLLTFAWTLAVALLVVIPDRRVLIAVAYAPLFLVGAPFHWPPVSFLVAIPWPVINQVILMVGGMLWAGAALVYQRRSHDACEHCGRSADDVSHQWTSPAMAARWGKWAVAVAIIAPAIYAATRYAWALGIPLGISEEFFREGQSTGLWLAGAGLATVAVGGAILTLGLVQRWGEIFPRWVLGLAGRRVPPALAIVPALLVAAILIPAGLADVRFALAGAMGPIELTWSTLGPTLLWPIWGVALAAATYAYYLRRRERCQYCGQG